MFEAEPRVLLFFIICFFCFYIRISYIVLLLVYWQCCSSCKSCKFFCLSVNKFVSWKEYDNFFFAFILHCCLSYVILYVMANSSISDLLIFVYNREALRSAVQAFRREEEFQLSKASKRRRERFEQVWVVAFFVDEIPWLFPHSCTVSDLRELQEKGSFGELTLDGSRGRGVQFPFAVSDRVIIKVWQLVIVLFVIWILKSISWIMCLGEQENSPAFRWTRGCCDNSMLKWMVSCPQLWYFGCSFISTDVHFIFNFLQVHLFQTITSHFVWRFNIHIDHVLAQSRTEFYLSQNLSCFSIAINRVRCMSMYDSFWFLLCMQICLNNPL